MSVQKLDFSIVKQAKRGFTTHLNEVVQNITEGFYLGVYVYLSSLPPTWNINRVQLGSHFDVGRDKINGALAWLNDHYLIEYKQEKDDLGIFGPTYIEVLDGLQFIENFNKNQTRSKNVSATLKTRATDYPGTGKSAPINNIIFKNKKITKKRPSDAGLVGFDDWYALYPRKEQKKKAQAAWKKEKCSGRKDELILILQKRIDEDYKFRERKHIPLPASYLNGNMWEDEIKPHIPVKPIQVAEQSSNSQNELRSTVPEYGPGHSRYDAIHGTRGIKHDNV
jgi:hypothetical protein